VATANGLESYTYEDVVHSGLEAIYMQPPHPAGHVAPMKVGNAFHSKFQVNYMISLHPVWSLHL
jgi:hypothetical protein